MDGLKGLYGQILQSLLWSFAAPSGLSLISLLPLWLMPSLPGLWVLVGGTLLAGLLWCHIPSSFINGLNGVPRDVQSLGYLKKQQPWSVLLHNFVPDLYGELIGLQCRFLGGAPCLMVLQSLSEQVYMYWDHVTDHVTLRLYTGGIYLTNYVTSEGNWLHQILFRA